MRRLEWLRPNTLIFEVVSGQWAVVGRNDSLGPFVLLTDHWPLTTNHYWEHATARAVRCGPVWSQGIIARAEGRVPNMPPRFTYWTILIDGQPTAFRAHQQADLLPTLVQIRRANPTAEMKWFARGRIWDSPAAATEALAQRRRTPDVRSADWRPGGQHKDPRARFQQTRAERRKKFARRQRAKKRTP